MGTTPTHPDVLFDGLNEWIEVEVSRSCRVIVDGWAVAVDEVGLVVVDAVELEEEENGYGEREEVARTRCCMVGYFKLPSV